MVANATRGRGPMSCLDVGGGSGKLFSLCYHSYTLNETDTEAIQRFRELGHEGNVIEGDFLNTEIASRFDLILIIQPMEGGERFRNMLLKAFSILEVNGILCFTFSNRNSYKGVWRRATRGQYAYGATHHEIRSFISSLRPSRVTYRGYAWLPFKRDSDAIAIPALKYWDLFLGRIVSISPWVFAAVYK
jgi:hypothetical protein